MTKREDAALIRKAAQAILISDIPSVMAATWRDSLLALADRLEAEAEEVARLRQANEAWHVRVSSLVADKDAMISRLARFEEALNHVAYRSHQPSRGCNGCEQAAALLAEGEKP